MSKPALVPKKRDPQKKAAYEWQWQWGDWGYPALSKSQVYTWVKWAVKKKYGFRHVPKIKFLKGGPCSWSNCEKNTLAFLHEHRNIGVVLHEAAHHIVGLLYGFTVETHGPEFMGVWVYLLEHCGWYPKGSIYASARRAGLKIDPRMSPKMIKREANKKGRKR